MTGPIDIGFRWLDDISVELIGDRPDAGLQLRIVGDIEKKCTVKKSREKIIRPTFAEIIPCDKTEEIWIELYEYNYKFGVSKRKKQVLSMKVPLVKEELYTKVTCRNSENSVSITLTFSYSPGGELRERLEEARRITEEQKVLLDKIRHIHKFFESLEIVCSAVEDLHPYIKMASVAIFALYKGCERQKECRDAARGLVEEMSELMTYGVEKLCDIFRTNSDTKAAFRLVSEVIREISEYIQENSKGIGGSLLRDVVSTYYKSRLEELRTKFRRAKDTLRDSTNAGTWKRMMNAELERKLKSVLAAHYQPGARCLLKTRVVLLKYVNTWLRGFSNEKIAWVYGYAGSGKSALLNSIAKDLETASIPFTCFTCKRDDAERSNVQRILPTICYDLTQFYGDYCGIISDVVNQPAGRSILTGDVATQGELLFGVSPTYHVLSPMGARRPPVHVILVDALDECYDVDQRSALAKFLRNLASSVPWIKVVITSRREQDIDKVLGHASDAVKCVDVNASKWNTPADIRLYIEAKSKDLELNLTTDQLDRLQEKASGLFIWCTTIFRFIGNSGDKEAVLEDVLSSSSSDNERLTLAPIYDLYNHIVSSAVSSDHTKDQALLHKILGVVLVAASRRPISMLAMSELMEEKDVWVATITRKLYAILYEDPGMSNAIRVCHPSVLDFLMMKLEKNEYSINLEGIHELMFQNSLRIMNRDLRFNMCELEESYRLNRDVLDLSARIAKHISEILQYSSLFWLSHLEQFSLRKGDGLVAAFLNSSKVLFWIELLSLLNLVDRGVLILQDCARKYADHVEIADLANEWERLLFASRDALQSTPHLYLSALSWLPQNSQLWDTISNTISVDLPMIKHVGKSWGNERWSENIGDKVMGVAYSSDGQIFAAACLGGGVHLWEARSGKLTRQYETSKIGGNITAIAFSPDTYWLASGHWDGKIRLWDIRLEIVEPRLLEAHVGPIASIAYSSDGKRIISGAEDDSAIVWDVETGKVLGFIFHDGIVISVGFCADHERVISVSYDKGNTTVRIWNYETGDQLSELCHLDFVHIVSCSKDGSCVATGSSSGIVKLWDEQTFEPIGDLVTDNTTAVISLCFSAGSNLIASVSIDHSIRVWNVLTRSLVCELSGLVNSVETIAISPDGQTLFSGSSNGTISAWDARMYGQPNKRYSDWDSVRSISYTPDGNLIALGLSNGNICFWNSITGTAIGEPIKGHTDEVLALSISGDGRWLASASYDSIIRLWDVITGAACGEPLLGHSLCVRSIAFSPDNQTIASGSDDKTVRLWDVLTHRTLMIFDAYKKSVNSVVFSVDGKWVISGSIDVDNPIRIWDTQTGMAIGNPLGGHPSATKLHTAAVAVSPDGEMIASFITYSRRHMDWGSIASLQIRSTSKLSEIRVSDESYRDMLHGSCMSFSYDSKHLILGSRVLNTQTGKVIGEPWEGHIQESYPVVLRPNSHEFASSYGGAVFIRDIRVRTDLELYKHDGKDHSEVSDEDLRIYWNASRAQLHDNDGWVRDGDKLLLWVPLRYRQDINSGTRLVVGSHANSETLRPEVDYQKLLKYSGMRWKQIYLSDE